MHGNHALMELYLWTMEPKLRIFRANPTPKVVCRILKGGVCREVIPLARSEGNFYCLLCGVGVAGVESWSVVGSTSAGCRWGMREGHSARCGGRCCSSEVGCFSLFTQVPQTGAGAPFSSAEIEALSKADSISTRTGMLKRLDNAHIGVP